MTAASTGGSAVRVEEDRLTAADGKELHLRRWLPPETPGGGVGRLVIVHGLGEHVGRYDAFARRAAARGWAVVGHDQRGHGRSDGRRGVLERFESLLRDLDAVVDGARTALPGEGEPLLFGHSLGGLVVLRWLQTRMPATPAAVLSAPWIQTSADVPTWKRLASRVLEWLAPRVTLAAGVEPEALTRDPEMQRAHDEDPLVHDRISAGLHRAVLDAQAAARAEGAGPHRIPLLVLVPTDDPLADSAATLDLAGRLEGQVTLERLEGGRHEPLNDLDRAAVTETVLDWIEARRTGEPPTGERVS